MDKLISQYLKDHEKSWSQSSLKSEASRLSSLAPALDGNPETLWAHLEAKGLGKYTRVTYWTRASDFWAWLIRKGHKQGPNPYENWREEHGRLFKHTYQRRQPDVTYSEARARIETISDINVRQACQLLLDGGLRVSELRSVDSEGFVTGKGGKRRKLYSDIRLSSTPSYSTVRRALHLLGLKPHDLRKIRATDLRRRGLQDEDLCKVFGWEDFNTAKAYLAPLKDEEIEALMQD